MAEDPAPGTTRVVDISLGEIEWKLNTDIRLAANSNADLQPPVRVNTEGFTVDPYVIIDGQPQQDSRYGATMLTTASVATLTKVTTPLDPKTLQIGSWARWLPYVEYLDPPANGGRRWYPQGYAHSGSSPRMSMYTVLPVGAGGITTGRGTYGVDSAYIDVEYTYSGFGRQMSRPAMVFDGASVNAIDLTGSFTSTTMAFVAVLHPSNLSYYGIYEATNGSNTLPLVYRYSHGRLDLYHSHTRVLSHETHKPAHYPVIMIVSLDAATDTGRMLCIDQTRTSRTFNVAGLDYQSALGVIGAVGQGTTDSPWKFPAEMDLLEYDIWDRALDFPEMESVANLLSLAYGVAA